MDQSFGEFLASTRAPLPVFGFLVNLLLAAVLAWALGKLYIRFGTALSNRRSFSRNFLLVTMTTMLIISIVKSSLALSMGLVGALSVIRFRTAIKEPEELAYLFLAISIGLGLGADQTVVTLAAFAVIAVVIVILGYKAAAAQNQSLNLVVSGTANSRVTVDSINGILQEHCDRVDLRRLDSSSQQLEMAFQVETRDFEGIKKALEELRKLDEGLKVLFLDGQGIL